MMKKIERCISMIILLCLISYLIYFFIINIDNIGIFKDEILLFFILITFFVILYFIFYQILKEKKLVIILSKNLENKDKELSFLNKNFHDKLKQEIANIKKKDKLLYEESKIISMNELISNIAHQWRQPLSVISCAATSMQLYHKMGRLDIQEVLNSCILINDNAQYLSHTIDSFKLFTKKRKEKDNFSIKSLLETLLTLTSTYKIKIITSIQEDVMIYSNKNEVIQILLNLINNSRDALEKMDIKDKYILIDIYTNKKEYIIKLKDSAGGINDEIINRVFEPYFTTKHKSQGTGLGLYIAYIITNKIKGKISVQNVEFTCSNNDKNYTGAEFTITLPIK